MEKPTKFYNMAQVFEYLDTINDPDDMRYDDCKMHSLCVNGDWYRKILKEVLKLPEKPKRVVDIGSNLNQYAYMFVKEGIEYIGIDANCYFNPLIAKDIRFIGAKYEDVAESFKDDVIISCLCVGYLVNVEDVKAKHLIVNDIKNHKAAAKKLW